MSRYVTGTVPRPHTLLYGHSRCANSFYCLFHPIYSTNKKRNNFSLTHSQELPSTVLLVYFVLIMASPFASVRF
jgi:hypothetical protein